MSSKPLPLPWRCSWGWEDPSLCRPLPLAPTLWGLCCIIVYFAVENVTFSHLGAHRLIPLSSPPSPIPERPLISLFLETVRPFIIVE